MQRKAFRIVTLVTCAGLVLVGCSTPVPPDSASVQRAAEAPTESPTDSPTDSEREVAAEEPMMDRAEPVTDDDALAAVGRGVYRGARVCVINARSAELRPVPRLNVFFTKADRVSKNGTIVDPGTQICGEAAYSTAKYDVTGEIYMMYYELKPMRFVASNGYTFADAEIKWNLANLPCAYVSEEPETKIYDSGEARFTLQRLNDSKDFKEFTITVADSQGKNYDCAR